MPPPPKKVINKKAVPDSRPNRQLGLRYQPNRLFESEAEINSLYNVPGCKVIKIWKVVSFACQVEEQQK